MVLRVMVMEFELVNDTDNGILEIESDLDGYFNFNVVQLPSDGLKLTDNYFSVSYFLEGYDNLKILTLDYESWGNEEYELIVINDGKISLYNNTSETTYEFIGREYIQF